MVVAFVHHFHVLGGEDRLHFCFYSLLYSHAPYYREFRMEWKDVDWKIFHSLRAGFLTRPKADYWDSDRVLEHYDLAIAPRIVDKWRSVWADVQASGKWPAPSVLLDWGCGTGAATLEYIRVWGKPAKVLLWDRSPRAVAFAKKKVEAVGVPCAAWDESRFDEPFALIVSHVVNEMDPASKQNLFSFLQQSQAFARVEPGTPEAAKEIIETRESVTTHTWIAPCPHQAACPLKASQEDWCHFFAEPRQEYFTNGDWARYAREMKIDLRSLPVSYLIGVKGQDQATHSRGRLIGRPKVHKRDAEGLICRESGCEWEAIEPEQGERLKSLKDNQLVRRGKTRSPWGPR